MQDSKPSERRVQTLQPMNIRRCLSFSKSSEHIETDVSSLGKCLPACTKYITLVCGNFHFFFLSPNSKVLMNAVFQRQKTYKMCNMGKRSSLLKLWKSQIFSQIPPMKNFYEWLKYVSSEISVQIISKLQATENLVVLWKALCSLWLLVITARAPTNYSQS